MAFKNPSHANGTSSHRRGKKLGPREECAGSRVRGPVATHRQGRSVSGQHSGPAGPGPRSGASSSRASCCTQTRARWTSCTKSPPRSGQSPRTRSDSRPPPSRPWGRTTRPPPPPPPPSASARPASHHRVPVVPPALRPPTTTPTMAAQHLDGRQQGRSEALRRFIARIEFYRNFGLLRGFLRL
jgi:hypothetical protein